MYNPVKNHLLCNRLRYDVAYKTGGNMVIKHKIWIAIGLGVILTTLYYYIYAFFQIWFDKLCENYYCIEFFPIGDFIACYIAIVGLYFVVTSLDAWKHQDQYQTAKQNIKLLHTVSEKLNLFNEKISNVPEFNKKIFFLDAQRNNKIIKTQLFLRYESLMEELNIIQLVKGTDYKITQMEKGLYQNEFNTIINIAHSYVTNIDSEIKKKNAEIMENYQENIVQNQLEKNQQLAEAEKIEDEDRRNTAIALLQLSKFTKSLKQPDLTQNQIDAIIAKNHIHYHNFSVKLKILQDKLNKYID